MALLLGGTTVGVIQRAFYRFRTESGSPLYIHMKTNINMTNIMWYIEAEGYNYGTALPVLCSWVGYAYEASNDVISTAVTNYYTGMNADGIYKSSDGYAVLRAYAVSHYYNGFVLNSYMANPNGNAYRVSISAAIQTSTSGNYY